MKNKTYRLMIKIHRYTGLKYLCISTREDYEKYLGSGYYWLRHLKVHGKYIITDVLFESEDLLEFQEVCIFFSELYMVHSNKEWANLIPEYGDNPLNLKIYIDSLPEKDRKLFFKKRGETLKLSWSLKSEEEKNLISKRMSIKQKEHWNNLSLKEKENIIFEMHRGRDNFFLNKDHDDYIKWRKNMFDRNQQSFETRSKASKEARLNATFEQREKRKKKIQQVYSTGKHQHLFDKMSKEREGVNNPAARIYIWFGEKYTSKQFKTLIKNNKWNKLYINEMFETREDCIKPVIKRINKSEIKCPYCNKINKNTSSFKRWHFNNCKKKGERDT